MREEKPLHLCFKEHRHAPAPDYLNLTIKLKHKHKTRDPKAPEDWVHRKFLLFPQHLPDLYLPTKQSFKQTLRESTDTGLAARWISLFQHGYNLS